MPTDQQVCLCCFSDVRMEDLLFTRRHSESMTFNEGKKGESLQRAKSCCNISIHREKQSHNFLPLSSFG